MNMAVGFVKKSLVKIIIEEDKSKKTGCLIYLNKKLKNT